jgi:hypothetical protein
MDNRQTQGLQNLRQILTWSAERPTLTGVIAGGTSSTPAGSTTLATPIAKQFAVLQQAVNDATARASEHEGLDREIRGQGAEATRLRKELVSQQMVHVATIARSAIPDVAKITEALRTPRRTRNTETLIATAEAMAKAVEQYKEDLTGHGLSVDFPGQIRGAAAALKDTIDARNANVVNRKSASKGLDEALGRGRKTVDRLTVLLKQELRNDPTTVSAWMQLRRLPRVSVKAATGASAPAPAAPTAPATVAATAPVQQTQAA